MLFVAGGSRHVMARAMKHREHVECYDEALLAKLCIKQLDIIFNDNENYVLARVFHCFTVGSQQTYANSNLTEMKSPHFEKGSHRILLR